MLALHGIRCHITAKVAKSAKYYEQPLSWNRKSTTEDTEFTEMDCFFSVSSVRSVVLQIRLSPD
ncbi:MAG: hypothetical protein EPN24_07540 [Candidatus Methanoperedens sp.]|nr:MAG: hypothetical protein EPN24_07540 [Candidatus Methanoperedens sp.]